MKFTVPHVSAGRSPYFRQIHRLIFPSPALLVCSVPRTIIQLSTSFFLSCFFYGQTLVRRMWKRCGIKNTRNDHHENIWFKIKLCSEKNRHSHPQLLHTFTTQPVISPCYHQKLKTVYRVIKNWGIPTPSKRNFIYLGVEALIAPSAFEK